MFYSKLAELYARLETTSSRLKKVELISELLKETDVKILPKVVLLLRGRLFPSWDEREIGIGNLLMVKIISSSTGYSENNVKKEFSRVGDYGVIIEKMMQNKKQQTLFQKRLSVEKVFENLQKLAGITGSGSHEKKFALVSELIGSAKPIEAKYIVRIILNELRIGVAEGVVRDSIAKAFLLNEDTKEAVRAVEWAWFLRPDYGEVALIAKKGGIKSLKNVELKIGEPYKVLLAEKANSLEEALGKYERVAIEYKYDGARICVHKNGNSVMLFTRSLENVTEQFPELIEWSKRALKPKRCIVEGEMLAINKKTGKPMPFQMLSQRIKRKYDIDRITKEIPIQMNIFDMTYLNGKSLFDESLERRWELLKKSVKIIPKKFQLAKHIVTKDLKVADKFYKDSLSNGQEGLMVKNLNAKYQPGRRVGYWLKVKPIMETLDLAIIGAIKGTGKRSGWFGSFILGCKDEKTGKFLECGMIGTGFKEKEGEGITYKKLTKQLKPYIISEEDSKIRIKPKILIEVAYEEIQKSPTYSSGFALRFPRVLRIRNDKGISGADSTKRIEKLFNMQRGKNNS